MSTQGNNINLLKQLPFYGKTIKPHVKKLSNLELLRELPFYDEINISRKERAFKKYAETYQVEIINNKSLSDSLSVNKISIKNLFDKLLREKSGFKYILSAKIILKKRINNNEHTYSTVYFNSLIKTVINRRYHLNESFEEILNLLDIWINESSAWTIDQIDGLYINTSNYEPLLGGSYISLPEKLKNSMKGLINLKNNDHKCFMWCHVRMLNPQNRNAKRIKKQDKKVATNLNYWDIVFPLDFNDYEKIKDRFQMPVNAFGYENKVHPLYISKKILQSNA